MQKRIYMTPERRFFLEERTETELLNFEATLTQSITGMQFVTPAATKDTFLGFVNDHIVVMRIMPTLEVVCDWFVDNLPDGYNTSSETPVFMPHWAIRGANTPITTDKRYEYVLPDPYEMVFVQSCSPRGEDMHYSFVALNMEDGSTRHPLIPNVYANGNLCFGDVRIPQFDLRSGFEYRINEVLSIWTKGRWNADLSPLGVNSNELRNWFAFDADSTKPAGERTLAVYENLANSLDLERSHEAAVLKLLLEILNDESDVTATHEEEEEEEEDNNDNNRWR